MTQKTQKKRRYYGGGMPKGHKTQKTLEKEELRQLLRAKVAEQMGPLVEAQIANAQGIKYLLLRNKKTGKFERVVKDMDKLDLQEGQESIEVWQKDPSVHAFTDLMNRTIDKPVEQVSADVNGAIRISWMTTEA